MFVSFTGGDETNTFVLGSWTTDADQYPDENLWDLALSGTGGDVDTATFRRGDGGTHTFVYDYQVITDSNVTVQRGTQTATGSATGSVAITTIDPDLTIAKSSWGFSPSVSSDNFASSGCTMRLMEWYLNADDAHIDFEAGLAPAGASVYYSWEVVTFPEESGGTPTRRIFVIT